MDWRGYREKKGVTAVVLFINSNLIWHSYFAVPRLTCNYVPTMDLSKAHFINNSGTGHNYSD